MRLGQGLADALYETVPAAASDGVPFLDRARAALGADVPMSATGVTADGDRKPGPGQLREGVRLVPVHPCTAVLDRKPVPAGTPRATPEPVTALEQQRPPASQRALAGGGDPGESAADDDDVIALVHRKQTNVH